MIGRLYYFSDFGMFLAYFQGRLNAVSFRECIRPVSYKRPSPNPRLEKLATLEIPQSKFSCCHFSRMKFPLKTYEDIKVVCKFKAKKCLGFWNLSIKEKPRQCGPFYRKVVIPFWTANSSVFTMFHNCQYGACRISCDGLQIGHFLSAAQP